MSSSAVPSPWMLPPILTTIVFPTNRAMYGSASLMAAAIKTGSLACAGIATSVATSSSGGVGAILDDVRFGEVASPRRRRRAAHVEVSHEVDLLLFHDRFGCLAAAGYRRARLHELDAADEQVHRHRIDLCAGVPDGAQHAAPVRVAAVHRRLHQRRPDY